MDPSLWGLFASALLSATLLPGGSEAVLMVLHLRGDHSWIALLAVAAAGNSLGGMSSWAIGRVLPPGAGGHPRARAWVRRWGAPLLVLAWVPIIGDPLCVAAGWLRVHWLPVLLFVTLGKTARYAVLLAAT